MTALEHEIQPQAIAAERAVLAAMMLGGVQRAMQVLNPDAFYRTAHKTLFSAMVELENAGTAVDLITLLDALRRAGTLPLIGDDSYVSGLFEEATTAANLEAHAAIVSEKARLRTLLKITAEIRDRCFSGATDVSDSVSRLAGLARTAEPDAAEQLGDNAAELFTFNAAERLPLGLSCMERFHILPGSLTVFAARPGVGKSAMLLQIALTAAQAGWKCLFMSLEMPAKQLRQRAIANLNHLDLHTVKRPTGTELVPRVAALKTIPLYLRDTVSRDGHIAERSLTLPQIINQTRKFCGFQRTAVFVDYLQLVQPGIRTEKRHEQVGHVARELKQLALSCNIPVVVAAQLGRGVEQRGSDAMPRMSDLRESGDIEASADNVVLMHETPTQFHLGVPKQRDGDKFVTECRFIPAQCRFEDLGWS